MTKHSLLFLLLVGLSFTPSTAGSGVGTGDKHVLIIGIDGTRSDALAAASTPSIDALISVGAFTASAFAGGPPNASDPAHQATSSGPGWASLLTGVWADRHDVYSNADYSAGAFDTYPHLFQRVRDAFPNAFLSSIVQWHPINQNMLLAYPGLADFTSQVADSGLAVETAAVNHLTSADPDVLFLHFDDVDHAGHGSGFDALNAAYIQAIEDTDAHIGNVVVALQARPNYANEDWLILISTDHGGNGTSHGGHTPGERTIWMVASGGDVLNRTFGVGPGHTAVARTALHHLGVAVLPAWGFVDEFPFGYAQPKASSPQPVNGDEGVSTDSDLEWVEGADATAHEVYFGRNPNPGPEQFKGAQAGTSFDPGPLATSTTYYWRIDTVTPGGTEGGDVWTFETRGNLADDLVLHLAFEGNVMDSSVRGNDASASGSPGFVPGVFGQALDLDGSADSLSLGAPVDTNFGSSTDFTVAFWMKSNGWNSDPVFLSNKNWVSGSNTGWILAGETDGTSWQWNYRGDAAPRLDFDLIGPVADGTWHHLAVAHDRDGDAVFYQDGAQVGALSLAGTGNVNSGLATAVGQDGTLSYGPNMLASLDDVTIWRRVLGSDEIGELIHSGVPETVGTSYCDGLSNSAGPGARIHGLGSEDVATNDFTLRSTGLPPSVPGIYFFGPNAIGAPFGDGLRCVGGATTRIHPPVFATNTGVATRALDLMQAPAAGAIQSGTNWRFQLWYRDSGAMQSGFNLTDGLSVIWL